MQWSYHLRSTILATTSKFKMAAIFETSHLFVRRYTFFLDPCFQGYGTFVGASNWRVNYLLVYWKARYILKQIHLILMPDISWNTMFILKTRIFYRKVHKNAKKTFSNFPVFHTHKTAQGFRDNQIKPI